jgi:molybdopterin-guanine dinucleotide biosynthesis protein A
MSTMDVAALLLTGGRSRRMGRDKAILVVGGQTLAGRTATLLASAATGPVIEVGAGVSGLPLMIDDRPRVGPLGAVASGRTELRRLGWSGAALVVATDLPRLDAAFLRWLAGHPFDGSVVPVADGQPQWLCARYDPTALDAAEGLVGAGRSALRELGAVGAALLVDEASWSGVAAPGILADVDQPADLVRLGLGHGRSEPGT